MHDLSLQIKRLGLKVGVGMGGIMLLSFTILMLRFGAFDGLLSSETEPEMVEYGEFDVNQLTASAENDLIKKGFEIFRNTSLLIGPQQTDSNQIFAGNNLACASCHLNGGTQLFAAPVIGVVKRFPQYRGREDKIGTIQERVNGCMERSMNGRKMPEDSEAMVALVAYMDWLGKSAPSDGKIEGQGFVTLELPNRAVDLDHGKKVFDQQCTVCHGSDGQGQKMADSDLYLYPPLWGPDSYNNGAGMTRVITAAEFIKANMPFGTTYENPILTDEEAYDVAGFINQQLRPTKANREADFPNLVKKPVSTPYGPYVDPFSEEQHQLGPFQPIMEFYQKEYQVKKTR
ncbi:MAG: c-type cytochrome [Bacteroidota bacterium]|nr:c-type cytochrome [Bacteroidota bacterium]